MDRLYKYFSICNMVTVWSDYWNMTFGQTEGQNLQDAEGLQNLAAGPPVYLPRPASRGCIPTSSGKENRRPKRPPELRMTYFYSGIIYMVSSGLVG